MTFYVSIFNSLSLEGREYVAPLLGQGLFLKLPPPLDTGTYFVNPPSFHVIHFFIVTGNRAIVLIIASQPPSQHDRCCVPPTSPKVRAIERARGKKAARKMLVFVNVLRDKSKGEVLAVAEAALDRLLRGIPMPETS